MPSKSKLKSQVSLDLQAEDSQRLLAFLQCSDCRDLADDAVETLCCHALLCAACLEKRHYQCPQCETNCSQAPSHLARRLIGYQEWRCPSCGKETTRSEQADHNQVCPQQERCCPARGCSFRGLPDAFLDHLTVEHKDRLIDRAERLFRPHARERRTVNRRLRLEDSDESSDSDSDNNNNDSDDASSQEGSDSASVEDVMMMMRTRSHAVRRYRGANAASRTHVRITGKNYCSGRLNGPPCDCCDGSCGPGNGCNCVHCMRLDLDTFNIATPRTLVNREGVIARMSLETGMFYCGRPVMSHDPNTDGFCGPHNGHNCHACSRLDSQLQTRYAALAAEWGGWVTTEPQQPRDVRDRSGDSRGCSPAGSIAYDTVDC